MDANEGLTVLWCEQCHKPFSKQSALKRHRYYCRSRKTGNSTRLRSCTPCARAKVRCDNRRPTCSRCATRNIACNLPLKVMVTEHESTVPYSGHALAQPKTNPRNSTAAAEHSRAEQLPLAANVDTMLDYANDLFENTIYEFPGGPPQESTDFWTTESDYHSLLPITPSSQSVALTAIADIPQPSSTINSDTQTRRSRRDMQPSRSHISRSPSQMIRSLVQRPTIRSGRQRVPYLILCTLKSYTFMLRNNTFPPFIHPSLFSLEGVDAVVEPMANCMSLVQMLNSGPQGGRRLLWQNVQRECERLCGQVLQLSDWELLAAMQALFVYVLIRLEEGETDYNNLDALLVQTIILLAQGISRCDILCHTQCAQCNKGLDLSWPQWLHKESRRRLALVYRVVNELFYFEPVTMCNMPKDFLLAPLPARKQLWEAGNERVWSIERQKDHSAQVSYGLNIDGEIVKLNENRLSCSDAWLPSLRSPEEFLDSSTSNNAHCDDERSTVCWEEWCASADSFGGLVMLTASLVA